MLVRAAVLFFVGIQSFHGVAQKGLKSSQSIETETEIIYDICLANEGKELGVADGTLIKVYSTDSRILLREYRDGHRKQILTLDISSDNAFMISGGKDSTVVIWDFAKTKLLKSLTYQKGIITTVKISPDGKYIASGGTDHKVYIFDLEKNEVVHEFTDHHEDVTSIEFSHDGKMLVTASGDKTVNVYDLENFSLIKSLTGHRDWVRGVSISSDGQELVSCGDDSKIIVWDMKDIHNITLQYKTSPGWRWVLCVAWKKGKEVYAYGDLTGNVGIVGSSVIYRKKFSVPVQRILFLPMQGDYLKVAVATRGKGVFFLDARNMKYKN